MVQGVNTSKSVRNSSGLIFLLVFVGFLAWAFKAIRPPPPKICGTPGGPPITALRIMLSDGRHLAYKEYGIPKDTAKHKFIFVHGFDSCRLHAPVATELSPELYESLSVYIVSFDRPGYGESDPHPGRTLKSTVLDIEELADQMNLGPKFYVIGFSMGGQIIWACLKYIPHRLAGATMLSPAFHYLLNSLPANITQELSGRVSVWDVLSGAVPYYLPWLTYWWQTQKIFPTSGVIAHSDHYFSSQDKELRHKFEIEDYVVCTTIHRLLLCSCKATRGIRIHPPRYDRRVRKMGI